MCPRILVVEDNIDMLDILCDELRKNGHRVTGVSTTLDACSVLDKEEFDVVLSDIHLDEMNGLELSKMLKEANVDMVRVAMSGGYFDENEMKEAGFSSFLQKPFSTTDLLRTINTLIAAN